MNQIDLSNSRDRFRDYNSTKVFSKNIRLVLPYRALNKIWIFILLFLYIYTPPFNIFPISPSYFIIIVALTYTLINLKNFISFFSDSNLIFIGVIFLILIAYSVCFDILSNYPNDVPLSRKMSFRFIILFVNLFFVSYFFLNVINKHLLLSTDGLLKLLLDLAILQSIFVIAMLVFPDMRNFFLNDLMSFKSNKIFNLDLWSKRSYGLSSQYLFAMPVFQGVAIMIGVIFTLKYSTRYLLYIPILLISILFNARIGIIALPIIFLFLLGVSFYYLKIRIIWRSVILFLGIAIISIVFVVLALNLLSVESYQYTINWLLDTFHQGGAQNIEVLRSQTHFPESVAGKIFGQGRYMFMNAFESNDSDIGYINFLYFGGITFSSLIYLIFILLPLVSVYSLKDFYIKCLILSYTVLLFIVNYKGIAFSYNSFINVFFLLILYVYKIPKNGLPNDKTLISRN